MSMMSSKYILSTIVFFTLYGFVCNFGIDDSDKEYLRKFGYLNIKKDSPFVSSITSPDVLVSAIKEFQRMAGINQTGDLDEETKEMMHIPRCGVRDLVGSGIRRRKRFALYGTKWENKKLTFRFINHPSGVPKDKVEKAIEKSLEYWQNVSGLTFERTTRFADIEISFRSKDHGDDDPFDGEGGTLAHAFFPTTNTIGGDAHFDDDEAWTFNEHRGTNLLQVAVHEFGHSLGLSHSDVKGSIMAPFYREYDPNLKLHDDDIKGIQKLYGLPRLNTRADATTVKYPTTAKTEPKPGDQICTINEPDAVFSFMDLLFVFKGNTLFVMKGFYDNKAKKFESTLVFPGLPENIDAAFYYEYVTSSYKKLDYIYFFKAELVWKYLYEEKPFGFVLRDGFPKKISSEFSGIPNNLDAVFEWSLNGKLFFFKGKDYFRYSQSTYRVAYNYPRPITNWNLKIDTISSVFNYPTRGFSELFFISGNQIFKYDDQKDGITPGFPKNLGWFFGCTPDSSIYASLIGEQTSNASINNIFYNILIFFAAFLFSSIFFHFF